MLYGALNIFFIYSMTTMKGICFPFFSAVTHKSIQHWLCDECSHLCNFFWRLLKLLAWSFARIGKSQLVFLASYNLVNADDDDGKMSEKKIIHEGMKQFPFRLQKMFAVTQGKKVCFVTLKVVEEKNLFFTSCWWHTERWYFILLKSTEVHGDFLKGMEEFRIYEATF